MPFSSADDSDVAFRLFIFTSLCDITIATFLAHLPLQFINTLPVTQNDTHDCFSHVRDAENTNRYDTTLNNSNNNYEHQPAMLSQAQSNQHQFTLQQHNHIYTAAINTQHLTLNTTHPSNTKRSKDTAFPTIEWRKAREGGEHQ